MYGIGSEIKKNSQNLSVFFNISIKVCFHYEKNHTIHTSNYVQPCVYSYGMKV